MGVRYKKTLSVLLVILSTASLGIGYGFVDTSHFPVPVRFLMNFAFLSQFVLSYLVAGIVFRDNKKAD